jgi:two-component sensor histidine kinase
VGDNGIGMPEDLDFRNTASMGLHLVQILSEGQLHGKIELDRAGGTTFRIRFKNHKYEARI